MYEATLVNMLVSLIPVTLIRVCRMTFALDISRISPQCAAFRRYLLSSDGLATRTGAMCTVPTS